MRIGLSARLLTSVVWTAALASGSLNAATPAEERIRTAKMQLEKAPDDARPAIDLAMALSRRARETSKTSYYEEGLAVLDNLEKRQPGNHEARKARAWLLLGQHKFAAALAVAEKLNKETPDDLMVYGLMADAQVELGKYADAEKSVQWMLDLRPPTIPSLTRAAHLRELFGDLEGAYQLMEQSLRMVPNNEFEDRAWVLTQMGQLLRQEGRLQDAESYISAALTLFPNYHYALAAMARIRTEQGKPAEAAALLQKRYDAAPHAENLYDLAMSLKAAGQEKDAREAFKKFQAASEAESTLDDNSNRELIYYYADIANKPAEALRVAKKEIARRQDAYTEAAYAWALYRSGKQAEAKREMTKALEVGLRDPDVTSRAAKISGRVVVASR